MPDKDIRIEKVVYGGKGLSRDLQKVAFVPFTLPGEQVRVQITREKRDYLEADPVEILEPSPERVSPECQYFGRCGGCQISHTHYENQIKLKEAMLRESLQRNGIATPQIEVFPSPPFRYRHRIRLKYNAKEPALGFHQADSNRIIDIKECLCATPGINKLLQDLRNGLAGRAPQVTEIECFENDRGETAAFCNATLPADLKHQLKGKASVFDAEDADRAGLALHFRTFSFPMHPGIFLQINPFLMNTMVQEVEGHHPPTNETAVELYSGTGFFTLPLAPRFKNIIACEENAAAIGYAEKHNATPSIRWVHAPVESLIFPAEATVLIADPPRSGLTNIVVENVIRHAFSRITYVSCDPSSFARDLKRLSSRYRLTRLSLLDLFPQTTHFETIALLEGFEERIGGTKMIIAQH
jgi:23S rRNA (uracil1939-C5)-methyltransferase